MKAKLLKGRLHLTLFVVILGISIAGVGWWALTIIGVVYNIVYPHYPIPSVYTTRGIVHPELSAVSSNYKPAHYLSFVNNDSRGFIPAKQNLNVPYFSIAFWAKRDGPAHTFDRPLEMFGRIRYGGGAIIPAGWQFDTGSVGKIGVDKMRFIVRNSLGQSLVTSPVTLLSDTWTHIVGTFNGKTIQLYKNGVLVRMLPFSASYYPSPNPLPVRIATGVLPAQHHWTGDLSDIQIYSRPLLQAEISSIFHGHGVIANGLIGRWSLDEGSGSSIVDSSGNGDNGTIYNAIWK